MSRYLASFGLGWILLSACQPTPTSSEKVIGIQDCGGNPWDVKFCPRTGALHADAVQTQTLALGSFLFSLDQTGQGPQLRVTHPESPLGPVFATLPGESFLAVGIGAETIDENRGSFVITDKVATYCTQQTLTDISRTDHSVILKGHFRNSGILRPKCPFGFEFELTAVAANKLDFAVRVQRLDQSVDEPNRLYFTTAALADESYLGFGMQYSEVDMKGKRLPILSQEQGIGRGLQPLSLGATITNGKGVAGSWFSSYGAVPHFISSKLRSLFLKNSEYMVFDFAKDDQVRLEVFSANLAGQYLVGRNPQQLITAYTDYAGRMDPLPTWMDQGAIIGLQGGSDAVAKAQATIETYGIPTSALWLQDWVGKRTTSFGSQLWWNWQLDRKTYPDWEQMLDRLKQDDIRVLTYVNPFLTDTSENPDAAGNLFQEAVAQHYLVKNAANEPYLIQNTSFSAGLLDLSNPAVRTWAKAFIRREMIATGASGWMADFGEALPFDSRLAQATAARFHNLYPESWAALNQEVLKEDGLWDDFVFFSRSAFTRSPAYSRLFWLGDQLVSWDKKDGMRTALIGLITSGLSGFALNHSDTGGYTTITNPLASYHRSKELFLRWTEMNAFTAVLRTHEGNIPEKNHQWNSDAETLRHFAYFAQIHKALGPYRRSLMRTAQETGLPLVRHLFIQYPDNADVLNIDDEFMLGADLLVAPVLDQGASQRRVYFPEAGWIHGLTGQAYGQGWQDVAAPLGTPPVFYRPGSESLATIFQDLRARMRPTTIMPTK